MSPHQPFAARIRELASDLAEEGITALGPLFDLASGRLVRYATALTRHQYDAEDAVQAALVKLAVRPELLARAEQPWPYLLRIVRNEALLIARRNRRLTPLHDQLSDMTTRCRVDDAEREETFRAVWRAVRQLPVEQAEVVVLKIWESLTLAEIGHVLGVSPNTVASRYRYGMRKLNESLGAAHREVSHERRV